MRANEQMKDVPVILFPVHGCEAARPMTAEEVEKMQAEATALVQKHWGHDGVKAIIQVLEMEAATKQRRACLPGATAHDAGQAHALGEVLGGLQARRWAKRRPKDD